MCVVSPQTERHERVPCVHRAAEPPRQGAGRGEVLQGLRTDPGDKPEERIRVCCKFLNLIICFISSF